jgi:PAS domain S-box-containing protein
VTSQDDIAADSAASELALGDRAPAARAAQAALSRAENDVSHLLVQSIYDYGIVALDVAGRVLSWNPGAMQIDGYQAAEIIGSPHSRFYPPEDVAAGKPAADLAAAARDGRIQGDQRRVRKNGERFWANVLITALRDENESLIGFAVVTRDLTAWRLANETARASEEGFRLIIDGVKDYGIFMLDPKGIVISWNPGAERIKGYRAEEIIGKHFSTFYPAEDVAADKPGWELQIASAEGRFEEEGWRVRKDGSLFWANVIITALRNRDDVLLGFAKVTRDLTERRAVQLREIANARRATQAEVANEAKSSFLAAMSHELRTPLNAIAGYVDLIEIGVGGPVTEKQRVYLGRIRSSQQHLLGIISDLLNYSRIEAGQMTYNLGSVPVHSLVDAVLPLVEPQAAAKKLRVEHGPCPAEPVALADRIKAEQIVLNLLSNAVKFTPAGGSISVTCGASGDNVTIAVCDTGPGIPAEKQTAIFEPFVQLGRSLNSPHEGTGLGLAISRDLARAMGGELNVESTVGEGSIFTLSLPVG